MTQQELIELQARIGTKPDGFWGPASIEACKNHLRRLMPKKHPFPKSDQASLKKFYGDPGRDEVAKWLVPIDVSNLGIKYSGKPVTKINVHEKCAASLLAALKAVAALPDSDGRWVLKEYAGVYNHRPMRGGTSWSLHAYGAAIDLAPDTNGLHTHWPTKADMPIEVMEEFARYGWAGLGWSIARDAMHFQATQ
jgi:hypothetical protein